MVENVIYYFSGTGNSLDVAKHIAEQLGDTILISMGTSPYDHYYRSKKRVGFVFPVYYGGIPDCVHTFIKTVRMTENCYVFAVATGKGYCGNALKEVEQIFAKREEHLSYGGFIQTVDNNIVESRMDRHLEKTIASSYALLKEIVDDIEHQEINHQGLINPLVSWRHRKKLDLAKHWDQRFVVGQECSHCGRCKSICPTGNIELVDGRPLFLHHCQACMACIQTCPMMALNYGTVTNGKDRYFHPNIQPEELDTRKKPIAFHQKIHYDNN